MSRTTRADVIVVWLAQRARKAQEAVDAQAAVYLSSGEHDLRGPEWSRLEQLAHYRDEADAIHKSVKAYRDGDHTALW